MEKSIVERMRKRGFSLLLFFLLLPIEIVYTIATRASGITCNCFGVCFNHKASWLSVKCTYEQ